MVAGLLFGARFGEAVGEVPVELLGVAFVVSLWGWLGVTPMLFPAPADLRLSA